MHAIAAMLRIPHVLVVDHSVEDRQLFQHVLIRHGCRVTVADDGFEALASAEEDPPAPGRDGPGPSGDERLRAL
jgi:PleD family two-component response regulator